MKKTFGLLFLIMVFVMPFMAKAAFADTENDGILEDNEPPTYSVEAESVSESVSKPITDSSDDISASVDISQKEVPQEKAEVVETDDLSDTRFWIILIVGAAVAIVLLV